jgi:hypothetical protein
MDGFHPSGVDSTSTVCSKMHLSRCYEVKDWIDKPESSQHLSLQVKGQLQVLTKIE